MVERSDSFARAVCDSRRQRDFQQARHIPGARELPVRTVVIAADRAAFKQRPRGIGSVDEVLAAFKHSRKPIVRSADRIVDAIQIDVRYLLEYQPRTIVARFDVRRQYRKIVGRGDLEAVVCRVERQAVDHGMRAQYRIGGGECVSVIAVVVCSEERSSEVEIARIRNARERYRRRTRRIELAVVLE